MRIRWLPLFCLPWIATNGAEIIWDPTEVARLGEQAAQISLQYSALIDLQQTLDGLSAGVGPAGVRGTGSSVDLAILTALMAIAPPLPLPDQAALIQRLPAPSQTAAQQSDNHRFWVDAAGNAAADGVAISGVLRQSVATALPRNQALVSQARGAGDLRGDISANSALCLAVFADLAAVEAALAVTLQQQAAATLAKFSPLQ